MSRVIHVHHSSAPLQDAEKAIALLSQNQELFIDIMMAEGTLTARVGSF